MPGAHQLLHNSLNKRDYIYPFIFTVVYVAAAMSWIQLN